MENQPFRLVILVNDERKLINENQVVSVEEHEKGYAYLRMSNGDEFVIKQPRYEDWENDFHSRH